MAKGSPKKAHKRAVKRAARRTTDVIELPHPDDRFTVVIVGAGASGIAAACALGQSVSNAGMQADGSGIRIVLVEKGRHIGTSILRSGNGRCNFSHANIDVASYNQPALVRSALDALEARFPAIMASHKTQEPLSNKGLSEEGISQIADEAAEVFAPGVRSNTVLRWFTELGLVWREVPGSEGLLYPASNKAESVLEVLEAELDRCGVERFCNVEACDINEGANEDGGFLLELAACEKHANVAERRRASFPADVVVYAAGGNAPLPSDDRGILGRMKSVRSVPVLGPLRTETQAIEGLDGIRVQVRLTCPGRTFSEEGEVLFREYGLSGIVVFNASRFVEAGDMLELDFVPDWTPDQLRDVLMKRYDCALLRTGSPPCYGELLRGFFLPEVAHALLSRVVLEPNCPAMQEGIDALVETIKSFELRVLGRGDERQCQVARGGISVEEVDLESLEAHKVPGFYFAGEALDVDGPCGGFNLHWAWASGLLVAASIAQEQSASGE